MTPSILDVTASKLSSMRFLYFPLAKQKHDSKKVPLIMSKKGQRGWRLEDNGRYQSFVCNLKNEN